jgi:hypothetical protein
MEEVSVASRLRKALHAHFDSVVSEPLPERWVDLIKYLNERERAKKRADGHADRNRS